MKPQLAANNPLPSENCTKEEAIAYLQKHIEHQNDRIDELTNALRKNENERQLRAWAVDLATRNFKEADAAQIIALAEKYREYADVAPEVPNAVN